MTPRRSLAIVLAAGEGTRMKSDRPKVLHEIAHRPMVGHVVATARAAGIDAIALVAGHGADMVAEALDGLVARENVFIQAQRLGTAHAVLAARAALAEGLDEVIVMFGDTPLVTPAEIADLRGAIAAGADVAVMGFKAADPAGYGRLIVKDGRLAAIREDKDCSAAERGITLCNAGLMALSGARALELLDAVGNDNAKGEYYLTDVVEIAAGRGLDTRYTLADAQSVVGVNDRVQLAEAEAIWQARRRAALMRAGVTMTAPETVFLSHDTEIGADTLIEPNVVIGPGVWIAPKAVIRAFSHLEGCTVASGAEIGPFARLRPGARLGEKAKVGNFCEVKNAEVEAGAKVNHLSYIGDARIGRAANIGAGTITCNYDGFLKHRTEIGAGAFIGSNTSLVAPITIGEEAYVASGSVVTADVPKDALAFGRARQENKAGLGARLRERLKAAKERRKAGA